MSEHIRAVEYEEANSKRLNSPEYYRLEESANRLGIRLSPRGVDGGEEHWGADSKIIGTAVPTDQAPLLVDRLDAANVAVLNSVALPITVSEVTSYRRFIDEFWFDPSLIPAEERLFRTVLRETRIPRVDIGDVSSGEAAR
jgi:hypothetical protein